jgi:malonyl CoA-acyl carrier protein transacylase
VSSRADLIARVRALIQRSKAERRDLTAQELAEGKRWVDEARRLASDELVDLLDAGPRGDPLLEDLLGV